MSGTEGAGMTRIDDHRAGREQIVKRAGLEANGGGAVWHDDLPESSRRCRLPTARAAGYLPAYRARRRRSSGGNPAVGAGAPVHRQAVIVAIEVHERLSAGDGHALDLANEDRVVSRLVRA